MTDPDARFVSKERVVRDDVLIYAEGDEIPVTDVDELKRQGYTPPDEEAPEVFRSKERVERDGVLIYSERDVIPASDADEIARQGGDDKAAEKPKTPVKKAARRG